MTPGLWLWGCIGRLGPLQIENGCRLHSSKKVDQSRLESLLSPRLAIPAAAAAGATTAVRPRDLMAAAPRCTQLFFVFCRHEGAYCMWSHLSNLDSCCEHHPLSRVLSLFSPFLTLPTLRPHAPTVCSSAFGICLRMVDGPLAPTSYSMRVVFWGSEEVEGVVSCI